MPGGGIILSKPISNVTFLCWGSAPIPLLTRRLWTMFAHLNGNLLNLEALGNSLGITAPTVRRYLDFFESSYMIRRIQPWHVNIPKR